jgi:hypothetical protein
MLIDENQTGESRESGSRKQPGIVASVAGMDTQANAVVPQHPHPLERNPSGNLRREEVPRMSPPYGSNWIDCGKAAPSRDLETHQRDCSH